MSRLSLFILSFVMCTAVFGEVPHLDEMERLKSMISDKATIDKAKFNKVSKLKSQLSNAQVYSDKVKILNELGDEYTLFMADSATPYYSEAVVLSQSVGDGTGL